MNRFRYFEPRSLADAFELLLRFGNEANVLAGGTDLFVEIKEKLRRPAAVVNIKRVAELSGLRLEKAAGLSIGALATTREIELSAAISRDYPGLVQAVAELGSIQVRNRATVIGNVCRASPSADTLPPLIADDAEARIVGPREERRVPLEHFFTGPGQTVLRPAELVAEINVPAPAARTGKAYLKHGRRKAMELATVGVATCVTLDREHCARVRIVLGAVAPTPIRARLAEAVLIGRPPTNELLAQASEVAMTECAPISNVRASADYRREMVGVLTARALKLALARAGGITA